jgi:hypothetical protein
VLGKQRGGALLVARIELDRLGGIARRGRALRPGQVVVGDDKFGEATSGGNPGKSRAYPAGPHEKDAHGLILDRGPPTDGTRGDA